MLQAFDKQGAGNNCVLLDQRMLFAGEAIRIVDKSRTAREI
jgi:hypothetical protein